MKRNFRYSIAAALAIAATAGIAQTPKDNQPEPVILLVPVQVSDKALDSGCWAQFYTKREFKGDVLTLVGPSVVASMDKGTARQLKRELDSVVVGPNATLKVYEHAMFKDRNVDFVPNSREGGLVRKLGFSGRIEGLELSCA
jgi:hypothetical protein